MLNAHPHAHDHHHAHAHLYTQPYPQAFFLIYTSFTFFNLKTRQAKILLWETNETQNYSEEFDFEQE